MRRLEGDAGLAAQEAIYHNMLGRYWLHTEPIRAGACFIILHNLGCGVLERGAAQ